VLTHQVVYHIERVDAAAEQVEKPLARFAEANAIRLAQ